MGVLLYNKTAYNIMWTTTPCFHCTPFWWILKYIASSGCWFQRWNKSLQYVANSPDVYFNVEINLRKKCLNARRALQGDNSRWSGGRGGRSGRGVWRCSGDLERWVCEGLKWWFGHRHYPNVTNSCTYTVNHCMCFPWCRSPLVV